MNKHYNGQHLMPKGGGARVKGMDGKPASAPFKEKVGFPKADLPGKTGPDRSAGTQKAKIHPDSKGL